MASNLIAMAQATSDGLQPTSFKLKAAGRSMEKLDPSQHAIERRRLGIVPLCVCVSRNATGLAIGLLMGEATNCIF